MPQLNLIPILRAKMPDPSRFQRAYLKLSKPVILTDFSESWEARKKWTFEYFQKYAGDVEVPLYGEGFAGSEKNYMESSTRMRFGDYIDLIAADKTQLRMFLFNIFDHIPSLCHDFNYPTIVPSYLTKYPFMFFGGRGSFVDAHYDVDLSHVFLTQFHGKRKVILFPPSESIFLYRHPLTVSTNVDIGNPDYAKYPKLLRASGYECILEPGETLFIPSGYWHYIYYLEGGFGLSLRSQSIPLNKRISGLWNICKLLLIDNNLSKLIGASKWYIMKEKIAVKRANRTK